MDRLMQRFLRKIDIRPDGCWVWNASKDREGYGQLVISGKKVPAHRASWQLRHGEIPMGMFVCHKCDVPACVNPDHLFLGTPKDNTDDMVAKGRERFSTRTGVTPANAKLTDTDVRIIRRLRSEQRITYSELARLFGVSITTICVIVRGEAWKGV